MRKILLAAALIAAAWCAPGNSALAQGCGQQNPNCIVPTAPLGTSNNQAASTKFVQQAVAGVSIPALPNAEIFIGSMSGVATAQAMSGDCSITTTGTITCTKTNGVAFAPSATIDTTNASNIGSGQFALARLPNLGADNVLGNPSASGTATLAGMPIPNCTGALIYSTSTHSFSCNTASGLGNVTGSGSSTNGHAAVFNNTSATGIQDGGTLTNSVFGRAGAVTAANGDYNAGQITYTPPGTGGVATSVQAELQRHGVWGNDYGANCNASGNDATALQNAINEAQTLQVPLKWIGNCIHATGLTVSSPLEIAGNGPSASILSLSASSAGVNGITVTTTSPVNFHDFLMTSVGGSPGTAAILINPASTANLNSRFNNLTLLVPYNYGFYANAAAQWTVANSLLQGSTAAVLVNNVINPDSGDSTITGSLLQSAASGIGLLWQGSGGLRVENDKILGSNMAEGILVQLAAGTSTSDFFVVGTSIEGIASGASAIKMVRAGSTGSFGNVVLNSNEFAGGICVFVPTDPTAAWITSMSITGNICQIQTGGSAGFAVDGVSGLNITSNQLQSQISSAVGVAMGTQGETSTNCFIGGNPKVGGFAASAPGVCTTQAPF